MTTNPVPEFGDPSQPPCHIFAINESGVMRIAPDGDRTIDNSTKHETLFHNADVLAAGEIVIVDGVVSLITDGSGSYQCRGRMEVDPAFCTAILESVDRAGASFTQPLRDRLEGLSREVQ